MRVCEFGVAGRENKSGDEQLLIQGTKLFKHVVGMTKIAACRAVP